ncbi:hypothetical protein DJ69_07370 [Halorubrum persicum]|uniref:Uncharacterized protein n=1 Tax=Halorubrum persicum TaxID=1383844 RepID=A0A2G1WJZ9_9EURY|nr:hypothetical protein DJ69_07370 [Halorubrum persicum]
MTFVRRRLNSHSGRRRRPASSASWPLRNRALPSRTRTWAVSLRQLARENLGWALVARRPDRDPERSTPPDGDDERNRREREAEARSGGYGGIGGG